MPALFTTLRHFAAPLLVLLAMFAAAAPVQAQGVNVQTQGGKTTQIAGQNFVVENSVMQVVNGKPVAVNRNVPSDDLVIGPVCGAYYKGQKLPECGSQPALFESAALGTCPAGSFFDIGRWSCWTCPAGFTRGGAAVDSDRACERAATAAERGNKPEFQPASQVGDRCPTGTFFDTIGGGSCWQCPDGYNMNVLVHVQAGDKCTRPARQEFSGANRVKRTIWPHECPGGTVFDLWDGGGCWQCPSGYVRNGNHIKDGNACDRTIGADNKPAAQRAGGQCEAGTFPHVYNFGMTNARTVCLKCPEGYDQVILEGGDSPKKCQTTTRLVFTKAEQKAALTCPAGQHFDFIGLTQQDINSRPQFQGQAKRPQPVNSGTCWSCPDGYYRSTAHVKNNDACGSTGVDWYFGVMREPGLFGLDGAAEVLLAVLEGDAKSPDPANGMVMQALIKLADATNPSNRGAFLTQEAQLLAAQPERSRVAAGLVFARLLIALQDQTKATAAEKRLIASFTQYVKMKRTFIAYSAKRQYDMWLETVQWREKNATGKLAWDRATMSAYGRPPKFDEAAILSTLGAGAASTAVGFALQSIPVLGDIASIGVGLALGGHKDYTQGLEKAALATTKTAAETGIGIALTTAATLLAKAAITSSVTASAVAAASAGAGFSSVAVGASAAASTAVAASGIGAAVGVVLIIAAMQLEQMNQFWDAPVKVGQIVARAAETRTEDLVRMTKTDGEMAQLMTYWSFATGGDSALNTAQKASYAGLGQQHAGLKSYFASTGAAPAAKVWQQMPGLAQDIGVSPNSIIWHIGTNAVAGGFGIYRWNGKGWDNIPGGGVRLDVDGQGNAWVVNDAGDMFRYTGSGWFKLPGKGKDIGVGANGTAWHIGFDTQPGGNKVYRWAGAAWQDMNGGAVRVDVDAQGNAWVVNDKGDIFRWTGNGWAGVPGKARDIGVGGDGSVFVVGPDGSVHKWTGSTWIKRDGQLNEISVDGRGVPFGANAGKQIFMGYQ